MWQRLSRFVSGKSKFPARKKSANSRLAMFESLEQRQMLTATPSGSEFLVSDDFQGTQRGTPEVSSIGLADSGQSVVVYHGRGAAGSRFAGDDREIFVQLYGDDGVASEDVFVANAVTRGDQFDPSVDSAPDGSFWVTWSGRGIGDRHGIYAQRFGADGATIGDALLVNSTVGGAQSRPDVFAQAGGAAVIVWSGVGVEDGNDDFDGVFMRRIDSTGALVGTEVRVNTSTDGQQDYPAIAGNELGEFAVTWSSREGDGDDWGVFVQQYNADGSTKGAETEVNSTTSVSQFDSDIGVAQDGSFVVAWSSFDQDGDGWGVFAQQFTSGAATIGDEIQVSDSTVGHQQEAAIAVAPRGEFIVAWSNGVEGGNGWETQTRSFNTDGEAQETPITVNATTGQDSGHQRLPAVDINGEGESIVVFQGNSATDNHGILGQRYDIDVEPPENVDPVIESINGETQFADLEFDAGVGEELRVSIVASDANRDDTLTFALDPLQSPDDATIVSTGDNSADILWTPSIEDLGQEIEFRFTVQDDGGQNGDPNGGDAQDFIVNVQNQAPVLDLNGNANGTGFQARLEMNETLIDIVDTQNLSIADNEQTNLESALAILAGADDQTLESLLIDTSGTNITDSYDSATGRLTLTGSDTIENYEAALRTLQYQNTATDRSSGGQRVVNITVNDGSDTSNEATVDITVVGDNAAPTLEAIQDVTLLAGSPLHIPLVASDADGESISFTATSSNTDVTTFIPQGTAALV